MKNLPKKVQDDSEKIKTVLQILREFCSNCQEPRSKHKAMHGFKDKKIYYACKPESGCARFFEPPTNLELLEKLAEMI